MLIFGLMKNKLILVLMMLTNTLFSQEIKVTRDIGLWIGLDFKKKIFKGFDLSLMQQIRTYKNVTELDDYLFDLGLKHPINKQFAIGTNLRYIYNKRRVKERENNFRYNLDIEFKKKIKSGLNFRYRLRYQKEYVNLFSGFFAAAPQNIYSSSVRNKVKLMFKYNKTNRFFLSSELFRLFELFREPYFNKVRFYLGDEIKTTIGSFDCSIGFEKELHSNNPYSFIFFKSIYTIKR